MKPASLTRSGDFRRVHSEGRRTRRNGVSMAVLDRGDPGPARLGYSVRSSAGAAVTRNRIKRRIRAAVRELELTPGVDIVVSGDPAVADAEFQVLAEEVRSGLTALGAVS